MPKSFLYSYWRSILLCSVIFVLSAITFKSIPDIAKFQYSDKVTHILMYAGLNFVAYYEYTRDRFFKTNYQHWLIYLFLAYVSFGGIIEILQGTIFKPRTAEIADWLADIIGLFLGLGVGKLIFKNK